MSTGIDNPCGSCGELHDPENCINAGNTPETFYE